MPENITNARWVSEYDYPNRRVTLTLADEGSVGLHWSGVRKDADLSDPHGNFDIYVAYNATGNRAFDHETAPVVKVVARLDDVGGLVDVHPDFDIGAIGSMTIWPYKEAGERFGLTHWMWWTGPPFRNHPRNWTDANRG